MTCDRPAMRRTPARWAPLAVVLALLVGGCGGDDAPAVESQPVARSGDVDAQIDVGGRSLHLVCQGTAAAPGSPTVILEAGLGGTTDNWFNVLSLLPKDVRACAYDRAGQGLSDPAPDGSGIEESGTAADRADDLDRLLRAAEIPPPYLLVAHSLGPWVSVVYAAEHVDDVAGMVLVDPRGPWISDEWLDGARGVDQTDPATPTIIADLRSFISNPEANDERLDISASQAQVGEALEDEGPLLGDAPVVVLAGAHTPEEFPGVVKTVWTAAWRQGVRSFLAASTAARLVEVDSGHMITDDAPESIVETVRSIVDR